MAAEVLLPSAWENLVRTWQELDVPEGWRAEIIEERIVMTPPPDTGHNLIADRVHKTLVRAVPDEWAILQTQGVAVPLRSSLLIPDLVVIPRKRLAACEEPGPTPIEHALLAVEITSNSTTNTDRKTKLWSYAHGGVPLYLLLDRFAEGGPETLLYSNPSGGICQDTHRAPFGELVTLPAPFELTIDSGEF
ncbi:Uma2 family endonuclease [Allosaccharopolyspora coralli]|uniref:Uma2 family endonuclease n=1 Tax=Allosaccharopolyspora coralli TaxID=2665642 RepID=A0A5Q3Q2F2_9PSEU|nr:Uma2 family endonuclease [Allosaccharopolyspora coralli]QGK68523.1 Uma2 family endonuclease [Allosaccharopolyspora coralli]